MLMLQEQHDVSDAFGKSEKSFFLREAKIVNAKTGTFQLILLYFWVRLCIEILQKNVSQLNAILYKKDMIKTKDSKYLLIF